MNDEPPFASTPPAAEAAIRPSRFRHLPGLLRWLFLAFVLLVLIGLAWPGSCNRCVKGSQTKALAQAKQVGLALRLFAADHDGNYPTAGIPREMSAAPTNSNDAFACLFPQYLQGEVIFGNKLSAYQTAPPDNVIDPAYTGSPKETLKPGENVYAYVMGLRESDPPNMPLVADGTDGTGHYNRDQQKRGGVWKGERAVVIRLDNSGALETLTGPDSARYVRKAPLSTPDYSIPNANLLDVSGFPRELRLLDPGIAPGRR